MLTPARSVTRAPSGFIAISQGAGCVCPVSVACDNCRPASSVHPRGAVHVVCANPMVAQFVPPDVIGATIVTPNGVSKNRIED